jgi:septum site-determining protein MinC
MDSTNAAPVIDTEVAGPAALLRGTARGLEWNVDASANTGAVITALEPKLAEAPTFFKGSNVRVVVDRGALSNECLVALAGLATKYDLRILEVGAQRPALPVAHIIESGPVPTLGLAEGSAPTQTDAYARVDAFGGDDEPTHSGAPVTVTAELQREPAMLADADLEVAAFTETPESFEEPTRTSIPRTLAAMPEIATLATEGTRLVVGPVRSGVILDHAGNLIVFGDVNPGAEVRATGNIVVLGRLRGTAHAAIGQDIGFILALRLEPQQLRIGRRGARAPANEASSDNAEIAYATGEQMIVERYQGRLPRNLATSI